MSRLHRFLIALIVLVFLGFSAWTIHRLWQLAFLMTPAVPEELETKPTPNTTIPSAPTLAQNLGPFDIVQAQDGTQLKKFVAFAQNPLMISWNRGATPVDASTTDAMLHEADTTIDGRVVEYSLDHTVPEGTLYCDLGTSSTLCATHIFIVGHLLTPQALGGETVYLLAIPNLKTADVYYDNELAIFDHAAHRFVAIATDTPHPGRLFSGYIATDVLTPLLPPLRLQNPVTRETYLYQTYLKGNVNAWYDPEAALDNFSGILNIPLEKIIDYSAYTSSTIAFVDTLSGPLYLNRNTFEWLAPNGAVAVYDLKPYFLQGTTAEDEWKAAKSSGFTPLIHWSDGRVTREERYILGGTVAPGLCHADIVPGTNIVDTNAWFNKNRLLEIGRTYDGDPVYTLRDKATNPYYKSIYDYGFASAYVYGANDIPSGAAQASYDAMSDGVRFSQFLADEPLFFWRDPRGHWRVYMKATYRSRSTCTPASYAH